VIISFVQLAAWAQDVSSNGASLLESRLERLKKAQELVALMNYRELFKAMVQQWPFDSLSAVLSEMGAENLPPERKQIVEKWIEDFRKKQLERLEVSDLEKTVVETMAELYTLDELQGLIAFYQSPIGQAYLKKQPEFTRRMAKAYESTISKNLGELLSQASLYVDSLRALILHGSVKSPTDEDNQPSKEDPKEDKAD
jgi:hypothetical protein